MRIKEIDRTANVAWSPATQYPVYIVAGTAAQQLDATFSTSSALEIYGLNLAEATLDMPLLASIPSECRFHKVLWGSYGIGGKDTPSGLIVAGTDKGSIQVYSASSLLNSQKDCLVFEKSQHSGPVKALDFNPFQPNLLASGGSESEILIWDMTKPDTPMTPGQKSQPPEEVACVSWNRQVQHILASTFTARCVVWDLRKNEPIIKISDSMSRIKAKTVAWHPDVATQLCISSEDDHTPVIQLWDLRYATSPLKILENHQKGVLSMAWCPQDADLLMTCGKDNRILCWNPNSNQQGGEVVYELPTSNQWCFDVQWCPRNPSIISSSSFDGHVTVYSLLGGGHPIQPSNKVADSFATADPFSQPQVPVPSLEQDKVMPLQKPPKWLRKPVGASFAFGGKLVSFCHEKVQNPQQAVPKQVHISQVITESELLNRSQQLENALQNNQTTEFCAMKAANCSDRMQESIWNFLLVNFESEPRTKFLQLLGYDKNELARKVEEHTGADTNLLQNQGIDATELAQKMSLLNSSDSLKPGALNAGGQASPSVGSKTPGSRDDLSDGSAAFDEIAATQNAGVKSPLVIPSDDDADGLMAQALLSGNFEAAVEMCLSENKMAEAILLAIAGGPELLTRTQKKYFQKNKSNLGRLISSIVTQDWSHIIQTCELDNWKEALAIILTYSSAEEFAALCDALANRLESEKDGELSLYASLCYICSGNVEKLVENWVRNTENSNAPLALQDLVEKVMILRKAVELSRGQAPDIPSGYLSDRLSHYAGLLAAQGSIFTAIGYLRNTNERSLIALQDRLFQAFGQPIPGIPAPQFPFPRVDVQPEGAKVQPQTQAHVQPAAGHKQQLHQAQARGNVQTTTTPSVNYYNPTSYQKFSPVNGPTTPTFTPGPAVSSAATAHKGGISHKYPAYPQASAAYGLDTYSQQPAYMQPEFNSVNHVSGEPYGAPSQLAAATQQNIYNPTSVPGGLYMPQKTQSMTPVQPTMTSYQDTRSKTAWNDPPLISNKNQPAPVYDQKTPLTTPMYGGPQPNEQPAANTPYNLYNPQEYQPVPQRPITSQMTSGPPSQTEQPAAPAPEPPKPVEKGPIPSDHQILQDIFNNLVQNCSQVATNAQMKRKLEDVSRKLELLYDRLRESSLSPNVLAGLHQIIKTIQQYDYTSSLSVYTQMISQGNFSEISSFMPGIKVLLQSAAQMQVYVKQ